jgi:signal transduction histidine kinase
MPEPSSELQPARILSVAEDELSRIVLDIHDGPVQYLFTALSLLTSLQNELAEPPPDQASSQTTGQAVENSQAADQPMVQPVGQSADPSADLKLRARLAQVGMLLESSLYEIRFFLGAFRPPEFRRRSLASIVEGLVIQHEEWTHTTVHLASESLPAETPLAVKMAMYRVLQEALTNGYRHGGVEEQWVRMWGEDGWIHLEVVDKGKGFDPPNLEDPAEAEREDHIGLRGMHDRVRLLGGTYRLESAPGQGTRVVVAVPVRE